MNVQRAYKLQAVNGSLLPVSGQTSGVAVLFDNGTFASSPTYGTTVPGVDAGTYTFDSATGAFTATFGGNTYSGVMNDALLILSGGGQLFISTRIAL